MRNAGLDEAQAGIKIAGRNISNLRHADDTTLMAESEEEPNSPLMKVKEDSEKAGLKLNIQNAKIIASGPITSWQIDGQKVVPLSMGFSRQEYWTGWPFLLQGIFLTWGSNPAFLHCKQILYHLSHGEAQNFNWPT